MAFRKIRFKNIVRQMKERQRTNRIRGDFNGVYKYEMRKRKTLEIGRRLAEPSAGRQWYCKRQNIFFFSRILFPIIADDTRFLVNFFVFRMIFFLLLFLNKRFYVFWMFVVNFFFSAFVAVTWWWLVIIWQGAMRLAANQKRRERCKLNGGAHSTAPETN